MAVTQDVQAQVADRAGETLSTGTRVEVFAGTDRANAGTLVEDFGDVVDSAGGALETGVDAPRRFAVHTDDGLLVFADSGDVRALNGLKAGEPAAATS